MKVYSIYILNKAGGLIYQNDINTGLNKLSANDYLVLAGTLHGVHAIGSKLTSTFRNKDTGLILENNNSSILSTGRSQNPNTNKTGLQSIETDLFNLYLFQSLSGLKFIIITTPNPIVHNLQPINTTNQGPLIPSRGELIKQNELVTEIFKRVYLLYSDYVMKDPFYSLDMPIKSALFDLKVAELIQLNMY